MGKLGKLFKPAAEPVTPPLQERPSLADYVYIVSYQDAWKFQSTLSYCYQPNRVYRTKREAESVAVGGDVILTCQVLQVDRRVKVEYTEAIKRHDEP